MNIRNEFKSEEEFITYLAMVGNLAVPEEDRIKLVELKCFVAFVLAFNQFGTIISQTARNWVLEYMADGKKFTEASMLRYRGLLTEKGWLTQDGPLYTIPPPFDYSVTSKHSGRTFTITVSLAKDAVGHSTEQRA